MSYKERLSLEKNIEWMNGAAWKLDKMNHTITSARLLCGPADALGRDLAEDTKANIAISKDGEDHVIFSSEETLSALAKAGLNFPGSSDYLGQQIGG